MNFPGSSHLPINLFATCFTTSPIYLVLVEDRITIHSNKYHGPVQRPIQNRKSIAP